MTGRRYPLARLLDVLAAHGVQPTHAQLRDAIGLTGSTLAAARVRGLTVTAADRYATRAGVHPSAIWPSWFEDAVDDVGRVCADCGARFLPVRVTVRFCSRRCQKRTYQRSYRTREYVAEANRVARRAYYAENAEYEKARERHKHRREVTL